MLRSMINYIWEQISKYFNAFIFIKYYILKGLYINVHLKLLNIQEKNNM